MLFEEIEDCNTYDFFLMKYKCRCEKTFKTIGVIKGPNGAEIQKEFKQLIPTDNIHPKQIVILYSEE
jgi:hypothetical protein